MLPYLKRVSEETRFLLKEPDEIADLTLESEEEFIINNLDKERGCLVLAFLDGEYVGNASFDVAGGSRRNRHRADIGIALYLGYTGMGIGALLFECIMENIEKCGYSQAELTVVSDNSRAIHLYEKFGFKECGRIPNANRYDDGTCSDDIRMVKML
ncbi:MAG: GNAT family N-acetyltransferase [Pseudobutyrivibrio sp.]|nr:GNAT family N-acetyltransferase [Pseudobutyrivibrio sp.]